MWASLPPAHATSNRATTTEQQQSQLTFQISNLTWQLEEQSRTHYNNQLSPSTTHTQYLALVVPDTLCMAGCALVGTFEKGRK